MAGNGSPLRVLILSDLHFCSMEDQTESWLVHDKPGDMPIWSQLIDLLKANKERIDLILCPGDITTRACSKSLEVAWEHLNALRSELDVPVLAVATGNHDIASRPIKPGKPEHRIEQYCDLTENLKLLSPPYPLSDSARTDENYHTDCRIKYFGADFVIHETEAYRLIVLNSCSRHRDDSLEFNRGSLGKAAAKWLEKELKTMDFKEPSKINLLICHHHPIKHTDKYSQYDEMYDGSILMDLLNRYGNWIVIHGHKHHARLVYSGAGNKRTPVFSAGTLSAHTDSLGPEFKNQFYIMNIEMQDKRGPRGRLEVWNWSPNDFWQKSTRLDDRVFTGVGFGFNGHISDLADQIDDHLPILVGKKWTELENEIPDLRYLVPSDYEQLIEELEERNIELDPPDSLIEIKKVG